MTAFASVPQLSVSPMPMPQHVKDANLDKALTASLSDVRRYVGLDASKDASTDADKPVDAFTVCQDADGRFIGRDANGLIRARCTSRTIDRITGKPNRHDLTLLWTVPAPGLTRRFVVQSCSECKGWQTKAACRHAVTLTTAVNLPVVAAYLTSCIPCEIHDIREDGVCICGETSLYVRLQVREPLPGQYGRGGLCLVGCVCGRVKVLG